MHGIKHPEQENKMLVRWMIRRDVPEVIAIESDCFEFPWSEDDLLKCLRQRHCIGMVVDTGERIVGHMAYELHKDKLQLLTLASIKQGAGTAMIAKLAEKLSAQRRAKICAMVRESNLPAHLFFKRMGFRATDICREFYPVNGEDAYEFQFAWRQHPGVSGLCQADIVQYLRELKPVECAGK